jgi:hypothetical protein
VLARDPFAWTLPFVRIATITYKDWCAYLTGLIEGDGSFNNDGLEIPFDVRDRELAHALRRRLRLPRRNVTYRTPKTRKNGNPGEGWYRLFVPCGHAAFQGVLHAINGRFVGSHKLAQIHAHRLDMVSTRGRSPVTKRGAYYVWTRTITTVTKRPG